jgi:hypothetical protein
LTGTPPPASTTAAFPALASTPTCLPRLCALRTLDGIVTWIVNKIVDEGCLPVSPDGMFHAGFSMPSENAMERIPAAHAIKLIQLAVPPF